MRYYNKKKFFTKIASIASRLMGSPTASILAFLSIIIWGVTGPLFDYSDTWQLVINTATTVITFLMVFLIQNTQNRDSKALHIKMDELLRVTEGAHTALLDLEELSDSELAEICSRYGKIARESRRLMRDGIDDTHIPHVDLQMDISENKKGQMKRKPKQPK